MQYSYPKSATPRTTQVTTTRSPRSARTLVHKLALPLSVMSCHRLLERVPHFSVVANAVTNTARTKESLLDPRHGSRSRFESRATMFDCAEPVARTTNSPGMLAWSLAFGSTVTNGYQPRAPHPRTNAEQPAQSSRSSNVPQQITKPRRRVAERRVVRAAPGRPAPTPRSELRAVPHTSLAAHIPDWNVASELA